MKNKLYSTNLQVETEGAAMKFADALVVDISKGDIRVGDPRGKGTRSEKPGWAKCDHAFHRRMDWKNTETGEKKVCHVIPVDELFTGSGEIADAKVNFALHVLDAVLHVGAEIATDADAKNFPPTMASGGRHNKHFVNFAARYGILYGSEEDTKDSAGYCYVRSLSKAATDALNYVVANLPDELCKWIADIENESAGGDGNDDGSDGDGKGKGKGGKKNERKSYMVGCESGEAGHDLPTNFRKEDDAKAVIAWAEKCPKCGKALKVVTLAEVKTDEGKKENAGTPTEPKPEENKTPEPEAEKPAGAPAGIPTLGEVEQEHGVAS